jgi:hypothetical protein
MHYLLALLLAHDTVGDRIAQMSLALENRDAAAFRRLWKDAPKDDQDALVRINRLRELGVDAYLKKLPELGTPGKDVEEFYVYARFVADGGLNEFQLKMCRDGATWLFRKLEMHFRKGSQAEKSGTKGGPSVAMEWFLSDEGGKLDALHEDVREKGAEMIRKARERCNGRLAEALRALPLVYDTPSDLHEIEIGHRGARLETGVTFRKQHGMWKIANLEAVELKK